MTIKDSQTLAIIICIVTAVYWAFTAKVIPRNSKFSVMLLVDGRPRKKRSKSFSESSRELGRHEKMLIMRRFRLK
jgi:hypothetical protein